MSLSAFGVEHVGITKAADTKKKKKPKKKEPPASVGRLVTGGLFPGWHAAVAGKPGHKLSAAGWELGGGMFAAQPGAAVGTYIAHDKGHYKRQVRKDYMAKSMRESYDRPTYQNSRSDNTKLGATTGAAIWGGAAAGAGAYHGHGEARRGLRSLDEIGAGPSKGRAAAIKATQMTRRGGKAALAAGGAGAVVGGAIGAASAAKKKKRHSSRKVIAKSPERMLAERGTRKLRLAQHSTSLVPRAVKRAKPIAYYHAPKAYKVLDQITEMTKSDGTSAFGVAHEVAKWELPGMGKLGSMATDAFKGAKSGAAGRGIGAGPGSTVGQISSKVGAMGRSGAQYGKANLKPLGIGAGAGGAAGFGIHRNNN